MCGRFTLSSPAQQVATLFDIDVPEFRPRYNVAPSQPVAVARVIPDQPDRREVAFLRWGLIPHWANDEKIGNKLVNARWETAAVKPSFRDAIRSRRCLIPADGFFEWKAGARGKQPFHIHRPDHGLFAFAGLWERWVRPDGGPLDTCTILTTDAEPHLRELHPRMPVIIPESAFAEWLAGRPLAPARVAELCRGEPAKGLVLTPVGKAVNDARFDDAVCVKPLGHDGADLAGTIRPRARAPERSDQPSLFGE